MRFADKRVTVIKRRAGSGPTDPGIATPRTIAPGEFDNSVLRPAHNRASRRRMGLTRTRSSGAIGRRERNARRQPLPWTTTQPETSEGTE